MARLKEFYKTEVIKKMTDQFGYSSPMQVPRIEKITLNMGVGEAVADKKIMEHAVGDMEKIAGQKAIVTKAKKSVAAFKIRDDYPVGCKVTLRRDRMYEFLDRLVTVAIPELETLEGFLLDHLMVVEITIWVLKSRSFFLKLNTIKSTH